MARPLVVGIAGGTGSGKTTVAHKLAAAMPAERVLTIEHDSYYRDQSHLSIEERAKTNFDHPSSLESSLLAEHLRELRDGRSVEIPSYDFATHSRRPERRKVHPAPLIIVEGILVFAEAQLREQMDIKIFVDTDADIRVFRRVRRDIEQRGRTFQSIREQYYATVRRNTRMSASVSTKIFTSSSLRTRSSTNTRMPSTMITGLGSTRVVSFLRPCVTKS
jgi:uridine kinase